MQTFISLTSKPMIALSLSAKVFMFILLLSNNVSSAIPSDWNHGCTRSYDEDGKMAWDTPHLATKGDLLLLFLSRTDDVLHPPIRSISSVDNDMLASIVSSHFVFVAILLSFSLISILLYPGL
jgi:hypothetical protein